jgi:hypothetical protein
MTGGLGMTVTQKCTLAWIFLCSVVTVVDTRVVQADPVPPNCDNACRLRQYYYFIDGQSKTYRKYHKATCEFCVFAHSLCKPQEGDKNTGAKCTTKAGGENANKYWAISSKSVCDHTNEKYIEAEPAESIDPNTFTFADDKYCPPPPPPVIP